MSVSINGKAVIVTPNGLKIGAKGKVQRTPDEVGAILSMLSKSDARKYRKGLRGRGLNSLAGARRAA